MNKSLLTKEELCQLGPTFSPVFDTITRAANVEVTLEK